MSERDLYHSARLLAYEEVSRSVGYDPAEGGVPPSEDYEARRIRREFSKRFHMALTQVEDLPLLYVLQNYYEDVYEELASSTDAEAAERWAEEGRLLAESNEERAKRVAEQAKDRQGTDELLEKMRKEEAEKDRLLEARSKSAPTGKSQRDRGPSIGGMRDEVAREAAAIASSRDFDPTKGKGLPGVRMRGR